MFLELKKAFDTVDHTLSLSKLDCYVYGITGPEGEWFRSYLSSRTQSCVVRGCINKQLMNEAHNTLRDLHNFS